MGSDLSWSQVKFNFTPYVFQELLETTEKNQQAPDLPEDSAPENNNSKIRYKCEECLKEFCSLQSLNVHVRCVHNGEKPFACVKCVRSFAYANSLKIHMLSHSNTENDYQKPQYPCDLCDKVMNHPSGLVYHKATEHSNGKKATYFYLFFRDSTWIIF